MKKVRALVITGFGINCEEEMAAAYRLAGAEAQIAHLNGLYEDKTDLRNFDVLNFAGGFSFGDDLGSGKVLANKLMYKKKSAKGSFCDELREFVSGGGYVFGVCNGFQVLVKMGLLPDIGGSCAQEATLTVNDSASFEDRWCRLRVAKGVRTPFLKGIDMINLPVRHGEGKLIFADAEIRRRVEEGRLACMSYIGEDGEASMEFPHNPNGSEMSCAALSDKTGRIFAMMPHPEAYLSLYNNPAWPLIKRENPRISEDGEGLVIFKNIVRHVEAEKY
ncbi:MAG TPA: phosphoribosylformylglycinamidine synthase [Candidatus Wallbacteria bacterium]|nr:phosphoribosylformylglycinamidine synthase [Candidatus Wallbacteria bacterium]